MLPVATRAAVHAGRLDPANAAYVLEMLDAAADGCRSGVFDAMVTAPVHKGVINDAGVPFLGHTEYLAERLAAQPSGDAAGGRNPAGRAGDDAPGAGGRAGGHHP